MTALERWYGRMDAKPSGKVQITVNTFKKSTFELPLEVLKLAYAEYALQYGTSQSFGRIQERGGFSILEVIGLLADAVERKQAQIQKVRNQ